MGSDDAVDNDLDVMDIVRGAERSTMNLEYIADIRSRLGRKEF